MRTSKLFIAKKTYDFSKLMIRLNAQEEGVMQCEYFADKLGQFL